MLRVLALVLLLCSLQHPECEQDPLDPKSCKDYTAPKSLEDKLPNI
jgi:hypothetical protein